MTDNFLCETLLLLVARQQFNEDKDVRVVAATAGSQYLSAMLLSRRSIPESPCALKCATSDELYFCTQNKKHLLMRFNDSNGRKPGRTKATTTSTQWDKKSRRKLLMPQNKNNNSNLKNLNPLLSLSYRINSLQKHYQNIRKPFHIYTPDIKSI